MCLFVYIYFSYLHVLDLFFFNTQFSKTDFSFLSSHGVVFLNLGVVESFELFYWLICKFGVEWMLIRKGYLGLSFFVMHLALFPHSLIFNRYCFLWLDVWIYEPFWQWSCIVVAPPASLCFGDIVPVCGFSWNSQFKVFKVSTFTSAWLTGVNYVAVFVSFLCVNQPVSGHPSDGCRLFGTQDLVTVKTFDLSPGVLCGDWMRELFSAHSAGVVNWAIPSG